MARTDALFVSRGNLRLTVIVLVPDNQKQTSGDTNWRATTAVSRRAMREQSHTRSGERDGRDATGSRIWLLKDGRLPIVARGDCQYFVH